MATDRQKEADDVEVCESDWRDLAEGGKDR